MALIVLCSAKGAPGVTTATLALAHAWPLTADGRVLAVEADPSGGDAAAGFLRGTVGPEVGVGAVTADRGQRLADAVLSHALALDDSGRRLLLPGPWSMAHASRLNQLWPLLAQVALEPGVDVLVDAGRIDPAASMTGPVHADVVLIVTGSSLRAVAAARPLARALQQSGDGRSHGPGVVATVVVGEREPYPANEVATALGVDLAGCLPRDLGSAAVLSDGAPMSRRFPRSSLMRSASALARTIVAMASDASAAGSQASASSVISSAADPVATKASGVGVAS